jgi:hypothetical protein
MATFFQSPDLYSDTDTPKRHYYSVPDKRRAESPLRLLSARTWWGIIICIGIALLALNDVHRTSRAREDAAPVIQPSIAAPVAPVSHPPSPSELLDKLPFVGQFIVRETLLTPTRASFPVGRTSARHHADKPYTFTVWGDVDSQNAFGAMLRQPFALELRYTCPQTPGYDVACWQVLRYRLGNQVYTAPKNASKTR